MWYCKLQPEFFPSIYAAFARSFGFLFGGTRNKCKTSDVTVISDRRQKEKVLIGSLSTLQRLSIESEVKMRCCRVRFEKVYSVKTKRVSTVSFSSSLNLLELLRRHCYFPEIFRRNLKFFEGDNFSDSYFYQIFESGNIRFPFCHGKKLNLGGEKWKIQFQKNRVWMGQSFRKF